MTLRLLRLGLLLALACTVFADKVFAGTDSVGADAAVLVNSASPKYLDFKHYLQSCLDHFGVPYTVFDISTNSPGTNLARYALLIIGHKQLDTNGVFLTSAVQANISAAVSNGVGLVDFDSDIWAGPASPRYQFVQDVFSFGYATNSNGSSIVMPPTEPGSRMHYITASHATNDTISLRSAMSVTGVTTPGDARVVAFSAGAPLVVARQSGAGRAVFWTSYDWMAVAVKGPMSGLDDLVWRSFVWAARKPFVMRGMPNFVTMRMDDVEGPFWWAHMATDAGFKIWFGPFLNDITASATADLRGLVTNGLATCSMHAFSGSDLLYWNQPSNTNWSDTVMSNRIYSSTQWHLTNGIPIAKVVVPHYSELGVNSLPWLKTWGVEYLTLKNDPSTVRDSPWLVGGPFRLYENRLVGSTNLPVFYADYLSVAGHPEFDGQFFNCVTEIRDDDPCAEWCPSNDVVGSVGRGFRQLKRAFDSLALGTLYTHERYIHLTVCCGGQTITTNNWAAIIQGVTNALAPYKPIYVTMDYACQYVRATRTARLLSADFAPASGSVSATLSGRADVSISINVFTGADNGITNLVASLPAFTNSLTLVAATLTNAPLIRSLQVTNGSAVVTWGTIPGSTYTLQKRDGVPAGWNDATAPVKATNGLISATDTNPMVPIRFYRVSVAP